MTYRVHQSDIDAGLKSDPYFCPIARAIKRRHPARQIGVGSHYAHIGPTEYVLPERVGEWIRAYDKGLPVEPIRFELLASTR